MSEQSGSPHPRIPTGGTGSAAHGCDWSRTPLGPMHRWPQALKTAASMVLGSNVPMFIAWGEDLLLIHNDAYGEMLLGDRRPALGRPLREIWADLWDVSRPNIERAMKGETIYMESVPRVLRRDGRSEPAWLTFGYNPIRDEHGEVAGLFGVVTAINDAEVTQRLQESEERFRLIADSAPVPIWVTQLDRRRGFVNRAYVDFLGTSYEEAIGLDWRTIIHPEDQERVLADSMAGETSLKRFELEARYRGGDGEWHWLRSISQPRWGPGGEHIGFIGVAHDITESKTALIQLRLLNETLERRVEARTADLRDALERLQAESRERERAEDALRQAQKMEAIGRLTGGIAHDFNNLLTPVIGGLERIVSSLDEPRLRRLAEGALESSRRGAKLTTQLLTFSRLQRISMVPVAVNQVIDNLRDILHHSLGSAIAVETRLDEGSTHALCDENQLENAILNLAINARDAMPDGGHLLIATERRSEPASPDLAAGEYVAIIVADTGTGMKQEVAARAVEPFFSTKPTGKGTGLGLAQVYGIARQAGGTLRIDTREGEGTRISILLPFVEPAPAQPGPPQRNATAADLRNAAPAACIMVVDDDDDVRRFVVDLLEDLGHRVEAFARPEPAIAAAAAQAPDIALVDFAMPTMNGALLAARLRAANPRLPIAFVTGYAESEQLDQAIGADAPVLRKPFGIDELSALVERLLAQSGR